MAAMGIDLKTDGASISTLKINLKSTSIERINPLSTPQSKLPPPDQPERGKEKCRGRGEKVSRG